MQLARILSVSPRLNIVNYTFREKGLTEPVKWEFLELFSQERVNPPDNHRDLQRNSRPSLTIERLTARFTVSSLAATTEIRNP